MLTSAEYYRDPAVRQRLQEYARDAVYLVGYGPPVRRAASEPFVSLPPDRLDWILENGLDLFRSNWDRAGTLGVLDLEYFNLDFPGEIFYRPAETFRKLEPVYQAARETFRRFGLDPICQMTGQGYHFCFRVPFGGPAHRLLERIGRPAPTVMAKYASTTSRRREPVPPEAGAGFDGMGRLMEYLAHCLIRRARKKSALPLVITDVAVGHRPGAHGREAVSVDLSMYADPIYMRDIRCPFSTYQKHHVNLWRYGAVGRATPVLISLPRPEGASLEELLPVRSHFRNAAALAARSSCDIPDGSAGIESLALSYRRSRLARFHREFDSAEHDPPEQWPRTYDRTDLSALPPCIAAPLAEPNDRLLMPTHLQAITRVLLKKKWHPKHIAGLLRSRYERDYGWGPMWLRYDAASRANGYVRFFAGLIAAGLDGEVDLNCVSHQEKGACVKPNCGFNLADYRL